MGNIEVRFHHPLKTAVSMIGLLTGIIIPLYYSHGMVCAFNVSLHPALSALFATLITCTSAITATGIGYLLGFAATTISRAYDCTSCEPEMSPSNCNKCCFILGVALLSMPHYTLGVSGAIGCVSGMYLSIWLTNHFYDALRQPTSAATDSLCAAIELVSTIITTLACRFLLTTICGRCDNFEDLQIENPSADIPSPTFESELQRQQFRERATASPGTETQLV
jgi:hypothetical protein